MKNISATGSNAQLSTLDRLAAILSHLKVHATTICTFPVFEPDIIRRDVIDHYMSIITLLKEKQPFSDDERELLAKINKLCGILYSIVEERNSLRQSSISRTSTATNTFREDSSASSQSKLTTMSSINLSEVISMDTPSPSTSASRIQVLNTQILEKWYQKNCNYPYLKTEEIEDLSNKTRLTRTQVKNWYV